MSRFRWVVSVLLLYHLSAILVDAIPAPGELTRPKEVRHPEGRMMTRVLTPLLDTAALRLAELDSVLFRWSQPVRRVTQRYIKLGLSQRWTMFAAPARNDQYIRIDYFARTPSGDLMRYQELILPKSREDRVRFFHDFQDKATSSLWTAFNQAAAQKVQDPSGVDELAQSLRFFKARFRLEHLSDRDQIVRTEVWFGSAPIPPPGDQQADEALRLRLAAVPSYYSDHRKTPFSGPYSGLGREERELDITWLLAYLENV